MRAWLLDRLEGIGGLRLAEVPTPRPGEGEVALAVRYASLNPADRYLAEGLYPASPPLPHVLGRDGLGEVTEVGGSVGGMLGVEVGGRRLILRGEAGVSRWGTFAETVVVPAAVLVEVPEGWSEAEAAGAPLVYLTAYQAITQWGSWKAGQVVLVSGASGGVGLATVQLASAMGLTVVGLSRDPGKAEAIRQAGARLVLSPTDERWRDRLYAELGRRPVDLVVDNIGGPLFEPMLDTLHQDGRVSVVGRLGGPVPNFNTSSLFFRRLRIGGVAVGTYTASESRAAWGEVVRLLQASGQRPRVDSVFEFERLPEAFERLRGGVLGKVLLRVR